MNCVVVLSPGWLYQCFFDVFVDRLLSQNLIAAKIRDTLKRLQIEMLLSKYVTEVSSLEITNVWNTCTRNSTLTGLCVNFLIHLLVIY